MKRRALTPLLIVVAGLAVAGLLIATGPSVEPRAPEISAPLVRIVEARPRTISLRVSAHGTVAPRTESDLVPEVAGPVVWMSPALVSGGFFAKGEALLRIDPLDYEVALEQRRAGLARAQSELGAARKEHDRQLDLAKRNVASDQRRDDAVNRFGLAEAGLREARALLARAERDLMRTEIHAPYDGRVRSENVDVGQFVNRGAPVARIYATDFAEVRLPIPDEELAFLDLPLAGRDAATPSSTPVILRARFAGAEHEWRGEIVRTEGELDPKTRMVNVVARVPEPYAERNGRPPLSVGLFVEAEILGPESSDIVVLPRSALQEGDRVLIVDDERRLRFREVDVLRRARNEVYITAGLEVGESICISPLESAVDGMSVRIDEATSVAAPGGPAPAEAGSES